MKKIGVIIAGAILVGVTVTGCGWGKVTEPFQDAPRGVINSGPMDVIEMSDGFSNVGAKCDGPNRVYVVFHGDQMYGSVAVAPNDPRCTGSR